MDSHDKTADDRLDSIAELQNPIAVQKSIAASLILIAASLRQIRDVLEKRL